MKRHPGNRTWGVLLAASLWLGGCAGTVLGRNDSKPAFADPGLSMQQARQKVLPGSSKADVLTALGPATVIRFDSAYEVWVYRGRSAEPVQPTGPGAELVILFRPAGTAVKSRLRPPDAGGSGEAAN